MKKTKRNIAKKERIVPASGEEIARRLARGEDRTDGKRVKAMSQEEVERLADEEEGKPLLPLRPLGGEGRGEVGALGGKG